MKLIKLVIALILTICFSQLNAQNVKVLQKQLNEYGNLKLSNMNGQDNMDYNSRVKTDSLEKVIKPELRKYREYYTKLFIDNLKIKKNEDVDYCTYIWALGLMQSLDADTLIIDILKNNPNKIICNLAMRSLSEIGTEKCGNYLYDLYLKGNKEDKNNFLFLLLKMHYKPILPHLMDFLEDSVNTGNWSLVFYCGKMQNEFSEYLIKNMDSDNLTIRKNIGFLLTFLIPIEAKGRIYELYWTEQDWMVRCLYLMALERIDSDYDTMENFFRKVVTEEKNEYALKFANETIALLPEMRKELNEFISKRKPDSFIFETEYQKLMESGGKEGSYDILKFSCNLQDEQKLIRLKERVLDRFSDECLYDYKALNHIIMFIRTLKGKFLE